MYICELQALPHAAPLFITINAPSNTDHSVVELITDQTHGTLSCCFNEIGRMTANFSVTIITRET